MKLVGQILTSSFLILLFDFRLKSFYGLMGIYDIPILTSYAITLFTFIVITNSFNLIDGLDGLAGTIASISLLAFGVSFFLVGDTVYSIIAFCMLGAVIAFLFFNWEPSEIFMGDTGALVIGMMISILAIHFIELNYSLPITHPYKISAGVSGAVCIILIPLADTLRVFILRVAKKQSPFTPDKNHIHHYIMRLGLSHSKSAVFLGVAQVICIAVFLLLRNINDNYVLLGIFTFCTLLSIIFDKVIKGKLIKDNS